MSDIFISYASKDRARAKVLADALESQGWSVWWDRKIPPGRQFAQVIKEAIDEAKCIIVLWSKESVKSEWVQNEAAEGARREILLPALIDDVEIPFEFRRIQAAQLVDWEERSPHPEFDTFLEAVSAILGQPLLPKATEPLPEEQEPEIETKKAGSKSRIAKVLAAICIITLITIVSIKISPKYLHPKTYSLTVTAVDGSILKNPDLDSYNYNETVNLEAVPNKGYSFTKWSGDLYGSTNPATLVMDADKSVTVSFTPIIYSLTATTVNGSITKSPNRISYNHGETVTLEAVPIKGYSFKNWSGDLSDSTNPTTLVMDEDKSVTAIFALKTYNLTSTAANGTVTKNPDQASYNYNETITLKVVPNTGYNFTNWSGDLSGSTNPTTLVMDANKSVTASFVLKTYNLTVTTVDGSVTKNPDQASYNHGEKITLEAVPNTGYSFTNWSGDLSGSTNPATLVMDTDKSVTASFALIAGNVVTNSIGLKLVYIPDGSFMMGSSDTAAQLAKDYNTNEDEFTDEFPQHQVRISKDFWMGQTEVTQSQYKSVMNAHPWSGQSNVQEDANNPAVYVTWDDAAEFCTRLSQQEGKTYRLPTEAEWEYACRVGTTTRFSFGDSDSFIGGYAWYSDNAFKVDKKYAHSVGQKKPNSWGLYDMHGNVFEWCSDWYGKNYYSNSPSVDPKGPSAGDYRSVRGGSWSYGPSFLRCSFRLRYVSDGRYSSVGFRVVRSQP